MMMILTVDWNQEPDEWILCLRIYVVRRTQQTLLIVFLSKKENSRTYHQYTRTR